MLIILVGTGSWYVVCGAGVLYSGAGTVVPLISPRIFLIGSEDWGTPLET